MCEDLEWLPEWTLDGDSNAEIKIWIKTQTD